MNLIRITGSTAQFDTIQLENQRLRRAVEELSILNELARAVSASLNSLQIMQTIIQRSLSAVNAEQGVITLVDREADNPLKTLVRTQVSSAMHEPFHLHQALLGWMDLNKKPLLINDPQKDDRFPAVLWDNSIRSLLCVPMMVRLELGGVLTVYNKKDGSSFAEEDQRLLGIIAAQSAQVVENARLNEEAHRTKVRIAADLHDEIGTRLSSIVLISDIVQKHATLDETDCSRMANIRRAAQETAGAMRDIVWLINPEHDSLSALLSKMKDVASKLLDSITYSFKAPDRPSTEPMQMETRRNLYLAFKEALNNIVKHSLATHVDIEIVEEQGKLCVSVKDNGTGFSPETVKRGEGLNNLKKRADDMGAELEIRSSPGCGTTIRLGIPIHKVKPKV